VLKLLHWRRDDRAQNRALALVMKLENIFKTSVLGWWATLSRAKLPCTPHHLTCGRPGAALHSSMRMNIFSVGVIPGFL
jgi:hypothetical protein